MTKFSCQLLKISRHDITIFLFCFNVAGRGSTRFLFGWLFLHHPVLAYLLFINHKFMTNVITSFKSVVLLTFSCHWQASQENEKQPQTIQYSQMLNKLACSYLLLIFIFNFIQANVSNLPDKFQVERNYNKLKWNNYRATDN